MWPIYQLELSQLWDKTVGIVHNVKEEEKNSAYGRHRISRPMLIEVPIPK